MSVVLTYVITSILIIIPNTFLSATLSPQSSLRMFLPYFVCESYGLGSGRSCQDSLLPPEMTFFRLKIAGTILSGAMPVIIFLFIADFKRCVNYVKEKF